MLILTAATLIVVGLLPKYNGELIMQTKKATFDEATRSCEKLRHGRLVVIHTEAIQRKVKELVKESGDVTWIWIGLNGTAQRNKMKFDLRWHDGTLLPQNATYSNFHKNVLNSRSKICCAVAGGAWIPFGMWIDISCFEKRRYICEYMPETKCPSEKCPECFDARTKSDCQDGTCVCKAACGTTNDCPKCRGKNRKYRICENGFCSCKATCASNEECPGCYRGVKKYPICVNGTCVCNTLPDPKQCTSAAECNQADCEPFGKIRSCQSVCDCEDEKTAKEFVFKRQPLKFYDAMKSCEQLREGRLVLILNERIQRKVLDVVRRNGDRSWVWIGLYGTSNWAKVKYQLTWLDNTAFVPTNNYSNFYKNVFNRAQKSCCAIAGGEWSPAGTWVDINCKEKRRYVCEYMPEISCTTATDCPICLDKRTTRDCEKGTCVCKN